MTDHDEGTSVFLPAAYDVAWSLVVLGHAVLLLIALVQWFRARGTPAGGVLDVLVIVLVPLIGPAAYLIGRRGTARPASHDVG
ncbi:hypothetical protein [Cellulomonas sp. ATA003]|uniref:hypothetical protein n=1 Tax=Cellulomonas sp. ATA003 TaxID=3073064 RepID=UPI0028736766|nr:hypothetical protein [Cellulomonas sp. ATA003]WNB84669.1 hypothetical protein REH70_12850 [Cellulomonas sp. ATA003]